MESFLFDLSRKIGNPASTEVERIVRIRNRQGNWKYFIKVRVCQMKVDFEWVKKIDPKNNPVKKERIRKLNLFLIFLRLKINKIIEIKRINQ